MCVLVCVCGSADEERARSRRRKVRTRERRRKGGMKGGKEEDEDQHTVGMCAFNGMVCVFL